MNFTSGIELAVNAWQAGGEESLLGWLVVALVVAILFMLAGAAVDRAAAHRRTRIRQEYLEQLALRHYPESPPGGWTGSLPYWRSVRTKEDLRNAGAGNGYNDAEFYEGLQDESPEPR